MGDQFSASKLIQACYKKEIKLNEVVDEYIQGKIDFFLGDDEELQFVEKVVRVIKRYLYTLKILLFYHNSEEIGPWLNSAFQRFNQIQLKLMRDPSSQLMSVIARNFQKLMLLVFVYGATGNQVKTLTHIATLAIRSCFTSKEIRRLQVEPHFDGRTVKLKDYVLFKDELNSI